MDVRDCRTVHRLPSSISRRLAERRPGSIGHITLRGKCAGARSAGKPHAACDVAGAGNGLTVRLVRHSHRKRGETDRPRLRSTAPALDPTGVGDIAQEYAVDGFRGVAQNELGLDAASTQAERCVDAECILMNAFGSHREASSERIAVEQDSHRAGADIDPPDETEQAGCRARLVKILERPAGQ